MVFMLNVMGSYWKVLICVFKTMILVVMGVESGGWREGVIVSRGDCKSLGERWWWFGLGGCGGGFEKWLDFVCILRVELIGIVVKLDMGNEKIRGVRDGFRIFGLSGWRIGFLFIELYNIWEGIGLK